MNIVSLDIENIKRLSAVFITTDGEPVIQVTGKNMAGKSSVLDAIAMALGGKRLCPAEPLRRGQNTGHIEVNLGDYIVTRRFWRKRIIDCVIDHEHTDQCEIFYGDLESSLSVKSPDNADYGSPQKLLDKLVSDLTFDPLGFLELQPKDQRAMVQRLVGLDFTDLDERRKGVQARVTEATGIVKRAERDLAEAEHYPDAPTVAIDIADLLQQLANAEQFEKVAAAAEAAVADKRKAVVDTDADIASCADRIERLRAELAEAEKELAETSEYRGRLITEGKQLRATADTARAGVPDTQALRDRVSKANDINNQVAANVRRHAIVGAKQEAEASLLRLQTELRQIDALKLKQLAEATFPVQGLAFTDEGLTFDRLPFEQASYAQQLRVAVAMGLAVNPTLKVLLIKHGNALDKTSLQLLTELAQEAGAQVWIEKVAESADGVSVFIEEGRVASGEPTGASV